MWNLLNKQNYYYGYVDAINAETTNTHKPANGVYGVLAPVFIMKKFKKFLNTVSIITSGMILSSLWITQTDSWKWYLPICLAAIVFERSLSDD